MRLSVFISLFVWPLIAFSKAHPGEFIVRVQNHRMLANSELSLFLKKQIGQTDLAVVNLPTPWTEQAGINYLNNLPGVIAAEPNYEIQIDKIPNDPDIEKLWGLHNTGQKDGAWQTGQDGVDIQAPQVWDLTTGSPNVIVAVVDTGVDYNHLDLKDNMWINEVEKSGKPGVDDDNNGCVDDIYGCDFLNKDGSPMDDNNHGSHVAGTIAARGDNGMGVTGVAWNSKIMALKAFDNRGAGVTSDAIEAIFYAIKNGAKIINCSWGNDTKSEIFKDVLEAAEKAGILVVAAAGNNFGDNDSAPRFPASYDLPNVVSVAAVDNRGMLASFSNFGRHSVHLAAPGVSVFSTYVRGYGYFSGTSMAAPHVSGVAALVLAKNPHLTPVEIRERMIQSSVKLESLRGKTVGEGIVSAYYSVSGTASPPPANHPSQWKDARELSISTPHPYPSDYGKEWIVEIPEARTIALHFEKFETEYPYDGLTIYDSWGGRVAFLTGTEGVGWTVPIKGAWARLVFKSDARENFYGFDLTKVAYKK